uniref:Olduvai domain-containing protein n=1 Tax=Macaca fascicularis TaxID=9541 RepID=A0A7N9DE86_MACFA
NLAGALRCLIFPGLLFNFSYFSRLSRELLEGEEPEVLQYSLDRCYSTPSSYLELLNSYQPYRSAFYSLEEQLVGLAFEVDSEDPTMKVIRIHRVFWIWVIFLLQVALTELRDVIATGRTYRHIN